MRNPDCPKCGHIMDTFADEYYCSRCRLRYTKDDVARAMNNMENVGVMDGPHVLKCIDCNAEIRLPNTKFCPYCGSQNLVSNGMSCPSCGKQVEENDNFCPNCAKPLRPNNLRGARYPMNIERVSNAWYLLPLFFSILGGIIGYVGVKDRDSSKASSILGVGLVIFVIDIVILIALL